MRSDSPPNLREFATEIVRRLRQAGYEALWAGGCVRDWLLGLEPKDFDVATNATPDEVCSLFGERRTLRIGASFGVVAVLGPRRLRVEVATFRQDGVYSDGRHPDNVTFSTAEQDAQRRDFTINGLFFDPLEERVIDYVGGQDDLRNGIVRAIGDPEARFDEDKLRMLRAIRFAATYNFQIDPDTFAAIQRLANEIVIVSAERIADEMRKMLPHPQRARAVALLRESNLLEVILPEARGFALDEEVGRPDTALTAWERTLRVLETLREPSFPVALAALVRELGDRDDPNDKLIDTVGGRWRLSTDEIARAAWARRHETLIRKARQLPWPRLQRILIHRYILDLLTLAEAIARVEDQTTEEIDHCRQLLSLPPEELNPPPLITGVDLIHAGLSPGPQFQVLLEAVRDAQLEKRIQTKDEALQHALALSRA